MKKFAVVAVIVSMFAITSTAQAAPKPAPKRYANCAAFNKVYPKGVTYGKTWVADAVKKGFLPPVVDGKVFEKNAHLDLSDKDLMKYPLAVACPVVNPVAPSGVKFLMSMPATANSVEVTWMTPDVKGPDPLVYDVYVNGNKITEGLTTTRYNITGLTAGTGYKVEVYARNPIGQTAAPLTVTTKAAPVPTAAPAAPTTPAVQAPVSSGATRYANCDAARAAGVTPIRRGTALYDANKHLDRDGDGIACE